MGTEEPLAQRYGCYPLMQVAQLTPGMCMPGHAAGDIVHIFHVVPNPEVRNALLVVDSRGEKAHAVHAELYPSKSAG